MINCCFCNCSIVVVKYNDQDNIQNEVFSLCLDCGFKGLEHSFCGREHGRRQVCCCSKQLTTCIWSAHCRQREKDWTWHWIRKPQIPTFSNTTPPKLSHLLIDPLMRVQSFKHGSLCQPFSFKSQLQRSPPPDLVSFIISWSWRQEERTRRKCKCKVKDHFY